MILVLHESKEIAMEHIQKYFPDLENNFRSIGRKIRIRVLYPFRTIPRGSDYKVEMVKDDMGSMVDILIRNKCVKKYSFQVLDADLSGMKLVMGVRKEGKVVKTWLFERNNGGKPASIPGLRGISEYEKAMDQHTIKERETAFLQERMNGKAETTLQERITGDLQEIGLNCSPAIRFGTAPDDTVLVDFNRIFAILDKDYSRRQILLKGKDEVNYLCGMDERHTFVAGVSGDAKSIREAHKKLRPVGTNDKDQNKRQGEWFFIGKDFPGEPDKRNVLYNYALKRHPRSKPHVAEMAVKRGERVYVKGWVEHEDHAPLFLDEWCLVLLNNEIIEKHTYYPD
jgi:hypothetical protein